MGSASQPGPDFAKFKANLVREKKLFEDFEFPAGPKVIGGTGPGRDIRWLRPKEIVDNPKFVVQGATRFDLFQGDLGNCWFVAACACLATSHKQLFEGCIPPDQDFDRDYAGIFRFHFWHFGAWVEVVVDDLLPCREVKGSIELVYARNKSQPNELWVPLFEKAYAKLNGSYSNLDSGLINDALVDFTGGISERIDVVAKRRSPGNLFETLKAMTQMASLVGTHIIAPDGKVRELPTGLFTGHAYSLTGIEQLPGTSYRLMRIRNPWGKSEWKGAWSDGSKQWDTVPENVKRSVEFEKLEDGEFWLSFEDWLNNFNRMAICHLSPDALTQEICDSKGKKMWDQQTYMSEWVKGLSAGGSGGITGSPTKSFWTNPQFPVALKTSKGQSDGKCHMIVSLMQKPKGNQYSTDIGFGISQLKEGAPLKSMGESYGQADVANTTMEKCQPFREISAHFDLTPGNYIVIPYTQFSNTEGEFLLRIYVEL